MQSASIAILRAPKLRRAGRAAGRFAGALLDRRVIARAARLPQAQCNGSSSASLVVKVVQEKPTNQSAAAEARGAAPTPQLIYDGDCEFCGYWARYWRKLTGDRVEYRPYQEAAEQYPAISEADFQRAVQFIAPDGHRASAAEASFLTLSHARGKGFWLALYRHLPGFAPVS